VRLALIADTHLPRGDRRVPARCLEEASAADLIVHLGDFSERSVLEELQELGRLVAVHGNIDSPDLQRELPEQLSLELEGVVLGLLHDAGPAKGRLERMRARFPDARAVLFGHSHLPLHESRDGFQIFNPGSPTERRRTPNHSMGVGTIERGEIELRHIALD
jgi:uncharacterized protein